MKIWNKSDIPKINTLEKREKYLHNHKKKDGPKNNAQVNSYRDYSIEWPIVHSRS